MLERREAGGDVDAHRAGAARVAARPGALLGRGPLELRVDLGRGGGALLAAEVVRGPRERLGLLADRARSPRALTPSRPSPRARARRRSAARRAARRGAPRSRARRSPACRGATGSAARSRAASPPRRSSGRWRAAAPARAASTPRRRRPRRRARARAAQHRKAQGELRVAQRLLRRRRRRPRRPCAAVRAAGCHDRDEAVDEQPARAIHLDRHVAQPVGQVGRAPLRLRGGRAVHPGAGVDPGARRISIACSRRTGPTARRRMASATRPSGQLAAARPRGSEAADARVGQRGAEGLERGVVERRHDDGDPLGRDPAAERGGHLGGGGARLALQGPRRDGGERLRSAVGRPRDLRRVLERGPAPLQGVGDRRRAFVRERGSSTVTPAPPRARTAACSASTQARSSGSQATAPRIVTLRGSGARRTRRPSGAPARARTPRSAGRRGALPAGRRPPDRGPRRWRSRAGSRAPAAPPGRSRRAGSSRGRGRWRARARRALRARPAVAADPAGGRRGRAGWRGGLCEGSLWRRPAPAGRAPRRRSSTVTGFPGLRCARRADRARRARVQRAARSGQ